MKQGTSYKKTDKPQAEAYPISDLVAQSKKIFAVNPECAAAALRGIETLTIEAAEQKIKQFMNKEVK